ncbi:MAG: hypothetical protein GXP33_06755 [Spirochaetes bacterium]|nr:hypothetical protein [Spirochaetota bacterium]
MRKVLISLFFIGMTTFVVSSASAEPAASGKNVKVTIMGDSDVALISGIYLVPGVRIVYQPKLLGAGGEVMSFYGTGQKDLYLLAVGLVKLGWFHLGLGGSMMVKLPQVPQDQSNDWTSDLGKLMPAVSLGVNVPVWKIGPGRLGFNASLDAFFSAVPVSDNVQNFSQALGAIFEAVLFTELNIVKLTGGLSYVIAL